MPWLPPDKSRREQVDELYRRSQPNVPVSSQCQPVSSNDILRIGQVNSSVKDHLQLLKDRERLYCPSPRYIEVQPEIEANHRAILYDWLVEVVQEYHLSLGTLYFAVNYCDRFLSTTQVSRDKLQLVGIASLFIANKYDTNDHRSVRDYAYISDNTYDENEIIKMEAIILNKLDFYLQPATQADFLQKYMQNKSFSSFTSTLAFYLSELTILDSDYLQYKPSMIAASSLCLACLFTGDPNWTDTSFDPLEYSIEELSICMRDLYHSFEVAKVAKLTAVRDKYCSTNYGCFINGGYQYAPKITPPNIPF
ncbi:hypothetical protein P9112_008875 [Eukaryota sp. TZLM1-RC]